MNLLGMKRKLLPLGSPQGGGKGGGGGGPAPTSQTVTQTNIPEYARPYVETMLGKSEALTDIEKNPYQAYGGQRIAEFSPLQKQAFENVANQQTASQLGAATGLAGAAGLGAIGAGADYRNMATNPFATQAYMSPYMQNVVNVQKDEALRDAQIRNLGANLGSARQGTYGGARQALAEQERNRNLQTQLGQIQAGGSQRAFEAAQQAQQFGTSAGLQGFGQALQGASTLGNLGQTQFGQQQAINTAQQNVGAIQQAQAQQGLDQAYQDFLKQKNYPYQQLAFQSDMLRGLPLSQAAQQQYTAPPSMTSQLGGLGMSALGIYGMSGGFGGRPGMKEGGLLAAKAYKEGGKIEYSIGGDIAMMDVDQLTEMLDNPTLSPTEIQMIEKRIMLLNRMKNNPETPEIMSPRQQYAGIDSIPTGDMVPEQMAGGGIVAFQKGGSSGIDAIQKAARPGEEYSKFLEREVMESMKRLKTEDPFKESRAQDERIREQIAESRRLSPYEALTMAGLRTMAGTSPQALVNLGAGGEEGLKAFSRSKRGEADLQKQLLQQGVEREKAQFGRQSQLLGAQQTALGQMYNKQAALASAEASKALAGAGKEDRNIQRAAALVGSDPVIKSLQKQLETSGYQPGTPEYNYFEQRIAERQNQIFKTVGVAVPEITPSAITFPQPAKKPGFFESLFPKNKPAPSQNKVVPFNQLPPAKG
jgi:hypothetical protein